MVAAAAFNAPLLFWARNAWDISSPIKPLTLAAGLTLAGCAVLWASGRLGMDRRAMSLGIGLLVIVFAYWDKVDNVPVALWVAAAAATVAVGYLLRDTRKLDGVILVLIAVVGVAPLLQVVAALFQGPDPYPVDLPGDPLAITATGSVEDVMVVIVDGYPSLRIAEEWFDHDTSPLRERLTSLDFDVEPEAWSQHTFTAPSVSALLELRPVIGQDSLAQSSNLSSLYAITRGDNLVSRTLKTAGFTYTHFESGWDVTSCGGSVDRCVQSPWIDETVGGLIGTSGIGDWTDQRLGTYTLADTEHTAESLVALGKEMSENGTHDYIFAHLLLPHDPPVVNENCRFEPARLADDLRFREGLTSTQARREAVADQMTCVDSLIEQIAEVPGSSTAVLITADHGTATGGQIPRPPSDWTDSDVAERFGILLAYRLPASCEAPSDAINTVVMRAIMTCAINADLPDARPGHLIGLGQPNGSIR